MSIALALTFSCPHLVCTTDLDSFAKLSFSRREKNYFQWGQPALKKGKANVNAVGCNYAGWCLLVGISTKATLKTHPFALKLSYKQLHISYKLGRHKYNIVIDVELFVTKICEYSCMV